MTLIKSISGIRGTIGGRSGSNLTPIDIAECTAGFGMWIKESGRPPKVVTGRDGRVTGSLVSKIAIQTLMMMGIDVLDLGLSTTPTVEMEVIHQKAGGGIIFTASHNPENWNALKFLNEKGEFISEKDGKKILKYIVDNNLIFSNINDLGQHFEVTGAIERHIEAILRLPFLDKELIRSKNFKVVVDCINSTGAISIIPLLKALGCEVYGLNTEMTGRFAHNPEPLEPHLSSLSQKVKESRADLGIAVDPDVDRLALICEDGSMFGEEYTLVAAADFILRFRGGNTVSNLSSTRALRILTEEKGYRYEASAVGEVHVVEKMKKIAATIGGEGNGGVILPDLHYGRDALAGIALILNLLAIEAIPLSRLKKKYPPFEMVKDKVPLNEDTPIDEILDRISKFFAHEEVNQTDGVKIDFNEGWVHLRKSNTEPIIRIYAEANDKITAETLIQKVKQHIY
ncbi:MAG TPA: phosphoglucosamine mutase [Saprospiraceae bacterium]|nr:phosphoglucosamine mutase [Saprospiraceae bacterium]